MNVRALFLFFTLAFTRCRGNENDPISHLILMDSLPPTIGQNATPEIVIRTNFSGQIEFREAEEFKVLLNITAPSILQAYTVDSQLIEDKGRLLLQVFQKPDSGSAISLQWIVIGVSIAGGIMLLLTTAYVVWWYTNEKYMFIYSNHRGYLSKYRSRNSMQLGAAAAELLGDVDRDEEEDEKERERRRLVQEKMRIQVKPETIIEESEDSADDDRTNPKLRFQISNKQLSRNASLRQDRQRVSIENVHGSGMSDYTGRATDDTDNVNDLSPDQLIAGADGSYLPLDELDDMNHDHLKHMQSAQSHARIPGPRGNLDYNIHTSKSDGDLFGDNKKPSEKEKVIIPPLSMKISPQKQTPNKDIPRRAEPNIYHRGLNLRLQQENNLSVSPARSDKVRAQIHTPENPYVNSGHYGQYMAVRTPEQMSKSRTSRESNDAYELYTYPADIPMSTFKTANTVNKSPFKESPAKNIPKLRPKPAFKSGSPNAFDFESLDPGVRIPDGAPCSPGSPGEFSMLSEGDSSDSDANGFDDDDGEFLRLDDSDIDIPPPEQDGDLMSNDSIPLPSPPPMTNQFLNYDTHGQISQLSPRQSLVTPLQFDDKEYGTCIALTGSPSPGGPYSKHSVNQGENRFVFPPPPTMIRPQEQQQAPRRELDFAGGMSAGDDYGGLPVDTNIDRGQGQDPADVASMRERMQSGGRREKKISESSSSGVGGGKERRKSGDGQKQGGGGRKGGKLPKHLQITMMMTICALTLISGVYCASFGSETMVNIIVFVPPSFPYRNASIISAIGKSVEVKEPAEKSWFVSSNPILYNYGSNLCDNHRCRHGCDDNSGYCICRHGYEMRNGVCEDINECQTGVYKCPHPQASCANTPGSYDCLCNEIIHLFKYKDLCLDCSAPCQKGTYEIQACLGDKQKKICKDCTRDCGQNYFMKQACSAKKDAVCLTCHPLCNGTAEYEFTQCSALQNRDCRDKSSLPAPAMSNNVILDDLTVVRSETVEIPYQSVDSDVVRRFNFERGLSGYGSEFWIEVEIKHFLPIGVFRSVNHSDAMRPTDFQGSRDVLEKYCPYPVPVEYELSFIKHTNVSYKGNTSQGLDTIEPCDTDPDRFPSLQVTKDQSVVCTEPGPLSDAFQGINNEDFKMTETIWEEKSRSCRRQHEACENCTRNCVQGMPQNRNECSVTSSDDTGRSPRLPMCFTCCATKDCSDVCKNYHDDRCQMVRCQKGNLIQFQLRPNYPNSGQFYCHVQPVLDQHLITVDYKVKYIRWTNRVHLLHRNLSVYSDRQWQETGKMRMRDEIIHIEIDSRLDQIPDIVQWSPGASTGRVGSYQARGTPLTGTVVSANPVMVRPTTPFGIHPLSFSKLKCEDNSMENVRIVTDQDGPYKLVPDLVAAPSESASYLITNKTIAPTARIGLNKDTSILKAIFQPAKVKFETLMGNLTYNATHWILMLAGELQTCPGYFTLNVSDPLYMDPLYHFDVGIECPNTFQLSFTVPTGDSPLLSKDIQVHIRDVKKTFMLRVHAPAQITQEIIDKETADRDEIDQTFSSVRETAKEPPHFSIVFIVVVLGVTLILLSLLLFGVAWKQGIPEGDILRFRLRHLVLLVVYITFNFVYSIFVSMSVFVLIVMAVNGDTTAFLKQYNQQRSVTSALSQLELDTMERHLVTEFRRQNREASDRKLQCYTNLQVVLNDVKKLQDSIEGETKSAFSKQNLKTMVNDSIRASLAQFSNSLILFRSSYDKYERYVLKKLSEEVDNTYGSVQQSKWLRGAQFLYNYVAINKNLLGPSSSMMPFMDWVNMETDMMQLAKGLTLPLPDLPNLTQDFIATSRGRPIKTPRTNTRPTSTQTLNQWHVQPDIHPHNHSASTETQSGNIERVTSLHSESYVIFFLCMLFVDVCWLLHRMVKASGVGKLLLYGYPIYVDVREQKEGPNNEVKKKLNKKSKTKALKSILRKGVSTNFIPKLICTLFVCLMVYFVSLCAYKFINRDTFNYLGYYNDMEDIMNINQAVVNTRVHSHAHRINNVEYPMYEEAMNVNLQTHQHILNLIQTHWDAIKRSHVTTYCGYLQKLNISAKCDELSKDESLSQIRLEGCSFPPVIPGLYERNQSSSSHVASGQMDGFLTNIRKLVSDTCYVIIIYMSAIVIKELMGTVLWIYTKRSGFVSLRIIYETDEAPGSADSSTTNK